MTKEKDTFQDELDNIKEKKLKEAVKNFRGCLRATLKALKNNAFPFEMYLNHIEYGAKNLIKDLDKLRIKKQ